MSKKLLMKLVAIEDDKLRKQLQNIVITATDVVNLKGHVGLEYAILMGARVKKLQKALLGAQDEISK